MRGKMLGLVIMVTAIALSACGSSSRTVSGPWKTIVPIPGASAASTSPTSTASPGPTRIQVTLGEASTSQMFIKLSSFTAPSGVVTFYVTNAGNQTHEFVVLRTDTPAGSFPITSFEGETDRFNEDEAGTNVGETGDMKPGEAKALRINLAPGHYAVACNLPGHYRMGMHQDFTVT
jgi:uncharacterized cupredoxin-like copper-binding protein